jgi:hypothetical protein
MKVKIGNKIYDAETEPVMLILTDQDKGLISSMSKSCSKYLAFPDYLSKDFVSDWAEKDIEE